MSTATSGLPMRVAASYAANMRSAGFAAVTQLSSLSFSKSAVIDVDASAALADANLDDATTKLSVNLDLRAGQYYTFSFYFSSGGPKVTLMDAAGRKKNVSMAKGFKVTESGTYQLTFEAGYSLKNTGGLDNLVIDSKSILPTRSGDKRIDALVMGGTNQWWHPFDANVGRSSEKITPSATGLDAAVSSARSLTYSFLSTQPVGQSMTGFQEMTVAQKAAVRKAFEYYGKIINVSFTEVGGDGAGDINFGTNSQASSAGYATPPNESGVKDKAFLFLANNVSTNNDAGMQEGGYGWMTVLHEIGHTLGLKHPGNYNAGGGGTPGPYLSKADDNRGNTIMSYYDSDFTRGVNATTAMVYDVAALQYLYGANKEASTAVNGTFQFAPGKNYLQTLWSANGTDTIDLSQLSNASYVDLNAGAYSSINIVGAPQATAYSGNRNVGIAYGSQINNVTLSSAANVAESVALNRAFASGGFDQINSFDLSDDKIVLRRAVFGSLKAANVEFGTEATTAKSKIIVNRDTGEIFYDADGVGTRSVAKKIAQYSAVQGSGEFSLANFSFLA